MKRPHQSPLTEAEMPDSPESPYDSAPAEDDLWFLPGPDAPEDGPSTPALPHRAQTSLIDPATWKKAESAMAADLARAAAELATLDQLCRHSGRGAVERLALLELESMLWAEGTRIRREHISQYLNGGGVGIEQQHVLSQAGWAMRRLIARPSPLPPVRDFLGLHAVATSTALPDLYETRPRGQEFELCSRTFTEGLAELANCHPLTQAAYGFALWQLSGISPPGSVLEPGIAAARIAAQDRNLLGFAPLAPGRGIWQFSGPADTRLRAWLRAIRSGAQAGMMELTRLEAWTARALAEMKQVKGNSPAKLITALAANPILTTEAAEQITGLSRDTAERLLARMLKMGLVREITGNKRFRLWAAA